eukprot:s1145_g7.t1
MASQERAAQHSATPWGRCSFRFAARCQEKHRWSLFNTTFYAWGDAGGTCRPALRNALGPLFLQIRSPLKSTGGASSTPPSTPGETPAVRNVPPSTPQRLGAAVPSDSQPAVRKSTGEACSTPPTPGAEPVVRNVPRVESLQRPSEPASHAPVARNLPQSSPQRIGVSVPRVDSPPRPTEPESHAPRNLPQSSPQRIAVAAASADVQVPVARNVPAISPQRMDDAPPAEQDVHVPVVRNVPPSTPQRIGVSVPVIEPQPQPSASEASPVIRNLPPSTPQRIGVASSPSAEQEAERPAVRKLPPSFPQRIQSSPIPAESPPVRNLPPSSPRSRAMADDEAPISRNVNPNWSPIPAESPPVRTVPPELPKATEGIFGRPQDRVRPGTTATADSDESETRTDPFATFTGRSEAPIQATPVASSGSPPASPSMSPLQRSRSADEAAAQRSFTEKCLIS